MPGNLDKRKEADLESNYLWTAAEICSEFGLEDFASDIGGVSIDSRTIEIGDLFVALSGDPGPRFGGSATNAGDAGDGHRFIGMAIEKGAAAVMRREDYDCDASSIPVADTLDGLWQLAAAARHRTGAKTVAVTGSSGKTTMRLWLETLLAGAGHVHASTGSYNNHWGVPLSLARMPAETDYGVFEVGTNHPDEIAPLSKLVRPDVAVLLNVLPAHIGNFENLAALRLEKLSIAEGLGPDGVLVLPYAFVEMAGHGNCMTFGTEAGADVSGRLSGDKLIASVRGQEIHVEPEWQSPERISGMLAAIAVLTALELDPAGIADVFSHLPLPEGRGNLRQVNGVTVIDDSYNANPASMTMSLSQLIQADAAGRKIALLGEMLELGDGGRAMHQEIASITREIDEIVLFGEGFRGVATPSGHEHLMSIDDFDLEGFVRELKKGDMVLVKGSNKVFWKRDFVNALVRKLENRAANPSPPR